MNLGVIGGGSWGTTLANLLAGKGYNTTLWVYERDLCGEINERRENSVYLPGFRLSGNLHATNDIEEAIRGSGLVVWVPPSHVARRLLTDARPFISSDAVMVSATKGIEEDTLKTNSEVIEELLPPAISGKVVYLSGPSFARGVAAGQPTAVTVASKDAPSASKVQEVFSTPCFRTYTSADVIGVEVGGAIKNVIALGAGISDGLGFGSELMIRLSSSVSPVEPPMPRPTLFSRANAKLRLEHVAVVATRLVPAVVEIHMPPAGAPSMPPTLPTEFM